MEVSIILNVFIKKPPFILYRSVKLNEN